MAEAGEPGEAGERVASTLVVIPTYNERDNLEPLLARMHAVVPDAQVLVVDDGSPDGTGELADKLAADDPRVRVLHRPAKAGLGAAYLAGFAMALEGGYGVVVEMDADGSHAPEELSKLLDALGDHDVVLGTRYIPGGSVHNWPMRRLLLSRCGNIYIRMALGMPFRDATGGYRAYRMPVLDAINVDTVASTGYSFQVELAWRTYKAGFRMAEVPISFTEREHGVSKMSGNIMKEQLLRVTLWGLQARRDAVRKRLGRRSAEGSTWP